ncbi:hypothetical protein TCDM_04649 [Trypanosoma cruzi Dm28c]|uniref:Uncharacterized protein n=1 Tax=Trypanosoma cruzi Dm28c TaxID=1416333 RepID=V5DGZ0_TRYCR|nr:hypothetical protein TCDM_04649 [Trypanosoma cruzi Dm28c]
MGGGGVRHNEHPVFCCYFLYVRMCHFRVAVFFHGIVWRATGRMGWLVFMVLSCLNNVLQTCVACNVPVSLLPFSFFSLSGRLRVDSEVYLFCFAFFFFEFTDYAVSLFCPFPLSPEGWASTRCVTFIWMVCLFKCPSVPPLSLSLDVCFVNLTLLLFLLALPCSHKRWDCDVQARQTRKEREKISTKSRNIAGVVSLCCSHSPFSLFFTPPVFVNGRCSGLHASFIPPPHPSLSIKTNKQISPRHVGTRSWKGRSGIQECGGTVSRCDNKSCGVWTAGGGKDEKVKIK